MYLLHATLLLPAVGLGSLRHQLIPAGLQLRYAVLELSSTAEVLGTDAVLQSLLGLHGVDLHLSKLGRERVGEGARENIKGKSEFE